jgi:hypothetical protein
LATRAVAPKQHRVAALTSFLTLTRARGAEWASVSADLRGSLATRAVAPKQHRGAALTSFLTLTRARGAEWASVSADLRGSLATRAVAPKQHRGLRRAFSPAFRAGSLYPFIPWRVGAEESGAAKYGFGRRDAARPARAAWAVQRLQAARWRGRRRSLVLLISGGRVNLISHPYARARR